MPDVAPLISVIIPVYNVGGYLRACVDSVIRQRFTNFEIILVDDGSTDCSSAICDSYAVKDRRIKTLHTANAGPSSARNAGISEARGLYILFIDADDFIGENSLDNLTRTLETDGEADVVFVRPAHFYGNGGYKLYGNCFNKERLYMKNQREALDFLSSLSDFTSSVCLKLIRRDLLISNGIFFSSDIAWGEDTDFCLSLYLHAQTYNYCDSYIYYYRKSREGSATFSFSSKKLNDLLRVISKWSDIAANKPEYSEFADVIRKFLSFQYCLLISGYGKLNRGEQKRIEPQIKELSWLFGKPKDRRILAIRFFYILLGLRPAAYALCLYEKIKSKLS